MFSVMFPGFFLRTCQGAKEGAPDAFVFKPSIIEYLLS